MPDYFHIAGLKQFHEEPVHNKVWRSEVRFC